MAETTPTGQSATTSGADLIAAERLRQITAEDWTPDHDDHHDADELARAGALYALPDALRPRDRYWHRAEGGWVLDTVPSHWPWRPTDWKPTPHDRVRELVKAGALIAAEIDRLQREEARHG